MKGHPINSQQEKRQRVDMISAQRGESWKGTRNTGHLSVIIKRLRPNHLEDKVISIPWHVDRHDEVYFMPGSSFVLLQSFAAMDASASPRI